MVEFVKSLRDGVLTLFDDTAVTPLSVAVALAEGDLKIKETRQRNDILDRGALYMVKSGDEAPVEWSFSAKQARLEEPKLATTTRTTTLTAGAAVIGTVDAAAAGFTNGASNALIESPAGVEIVSYNGLAGNQLQAVIRGIAGTADIEHPPPMTIHEVALTARKWLEFLMGRGSYAGVVSTLAADTSVLALTHKWALLDKAGAAEETVVLEHAFVSSLDVQEGDPYNTIVAAGRAWSVAVGIE